jgi:hypothetical protein
MRASKKFAGGSDINIRTDLNSTVTSSEKRYLWTDPGVLADLQVTVIHLYAIGDLSANTDL